MYPTYQPVHDPTAVIGRRFGAWIIDFMIGAIMLFVLIATFAEQRNFTTAAQAEQFCDTVNNGDEYVCGPSDTTAIIVKYGDLGIVAIVGFGYWFLNDAVLTGITGFSIGKGIVGLRVVRQKDGRLAGFGRSLARWALWIADGVPCVPIVGLVTANASKGHRRVGDMVAKTFVVDKHQVGIPPRVPGVTADSSAFPPAYPGAYPSAPGYPGGYPGPSGYPGPGGYPGMPGQPVAPSYPPPWAAPQPSAPPPAAPQQPAPPQWGMPEGSGPVWAPPPAMPAPQPAPWAPTPPATPSPMPGVDPTLVQPVYNEPPPTQQLPAVAPPTAAGGPGIDGPLWDDARDAYIQWDQDINRWVQWDEHTREWHPL